MGGNNLLIGLGGIGEKSPDEALPGDVKKPEKPGFLIIEYTQGKNSILGPDKARQEESTDE